jgi:oxalate decarboxylase/phosphoglucose isomerase-like protein (cupin superfamily)
MQPFVERDPQNRRTVAMWDECGMRFRLNTVEPGGKIELHKHSYAHVAAVWGAFEVTVIDEAGAISTQRVESGALTVPAMCGHEFVYLGTQGPGTVLCFWPIGHDGAK